VWFLPIQRNKLWYHAVSISRGMRAALRISLTTTHCACLNILMHWILHIRRHTFLLKDKLCRIWMWTSRDACDSHECYNAWSCRKGEKHHCVHNACMMILDCFIKFIFKLFFGCCFIFFSSSYKLCLISHDHIWIDVSISYWSVVSIPYDHILNCCFNFLLNCSSFNPLWPYWIVVSILI